MEKRLEENNVKNENDRKKTYLRAYTERESNGLNQRLKKSET